MNEDLSPDHSSERVPPNTANKQRAGAKKPRLAHSLRWAAKSHFGDAPLWKAPPWKAPLWDAPVKEAPQWEAPLWEAPVKEAPVEDAPLWEAPPD